MLRLCKYCTFYKKKPINNHFFGNKHYTYEMENSVVPDSSTEITQQLKLYRGGQIVLDKNLKNGIATLCFDHSEKKNDISTKYLRIIQTSNFLN